MPDYGVLFIILSIIIGAILVAWNRGGFKEIRRTVLLGIVLLIVIIFVLSSVMLFGNTVLAINETFLFLFVGVLFLIILLSALIMLHKFHTGEGGEYPKGEMDEFTIRWIIRLKNIGFNPTASIILGIVTYSLVFFALTACWDGCGYLESFLPIAGFFLLQPFGILFLSVGYIWSKNKEKVEAIIGRAKQK